MKQIKLKTIASFYCREMAGNGLLLLLFCLLDVRWIQGERDVQDEFLVHAKSILRYVYIVASSSLKAKYFNRFIVPVTLRLAS